MRALRPALLAAFALVAALGAVGAHGQGGSRRDRDWDYRRADPAAVVAAELAFARAAQEDGQWTAFAEYATKDAVMFVPQPVIAHDWLKGRANPPQAVRWQPHQVWSSCDGSLAVTKGAWQRPDGSAGYFTTVWQRQGKRGKTEYRWVMDQGDALAEPLPAPEMIAAQTAECGRAAEAWDSAQADWEANSDAAEAAAGFGESVDGTLAYRYRVLPSGARTTEVLLLKGGKMEQVLLSEVAAE
jgi:hypothetical protein